MDQKGTLSGTNFQHQPIGMPPMAQQPSALSRLIAVLPKLAFFPLVVSVVALGLQAGLPIGYRPSDLIGGFYGATEAADLNAKRAAQAKTERQLADARAAPPAQWQMEQQLSQAQQQNRLESLQGQAAVANMADVACMASGIMGQLMGNNDPLARTARGACGVGDGLRRSMTNSLGNAEREGSGIEQRATPAQPDATPTEPPPVLRAAPPEPERSGNAWDDYTPSYAAPPANDAGNGYAPFNPNIQPDGETHFVRPNQLAQP